MRKGENTRESLFFDGGGGKKGYFRDSEGGRPAGTRKFLYNAAERRKAARGGELSLSGGGKREEGFTSLSKDHVDQNGGGE